MKWPYSHKRATEFESSELPATTKQIRYIGYLSNENTQDILDSIKPGMQIALLTLGQAMFVIKCLKGEIEPVKETLEKEVEEIWNQN